jgi:hypothetical protein
MEVTQYHAVQNVDLKHNTTALYHDMIPYITNKPQNARNTKYRLKKKCFNRVQE